MTSPRSISVLALFTLSLLSNACGPEGIMADDSTAETSASTGDGDGDQGGDGDADGEDPSADTDPSGDGDGDGEGLLRWEIRMPDFSPPAPYPTFYSCYSQTISVSDAVHIVGFEPKVTDPHVHHYVVQMLPTPQVDDPSSLCLEDPWTDMLWGWAPGGESLYLPPEAGFRAGDNGTVTVRFQVHYDNPLQQSFTDSGGFDILYTDELRPYDAGFAAFGDIHNIYIPANEPAHEHVASCSPTFTQTIFEGPLNVIGTWLHAHNRGSVLWGEVIPAGNLAPYELGREDPYMFDYQTVQPSPEGTVLMPGDEIRTHCVFDNSGNADPVQGGAETANEMCVNFVLYYPKSDQLDECGNL
jgi:dopamine beta-monooxygenase